MGTNSLINSVEIDDVTFQKNLKLQLERKDYEEIIGDFCSWLFFFTEFDSQRSKRISEILIQELDYITKEKNDLICMAYCCLLKSLIELNDSEGVLRAYKIALRIFQQKNLFNCGEEIIHTMFLGLNKKDLFQLEVHTAILKEAIYFLNHFKKYNQSIQLMINASQVFCTFQAFQSAYRILSDAEEIASKEDLLIELAEIYCAVGLVAYNEKDFEYVKEAFENAISIYHKEQTPVPNKIIINLATSYMQLELYEEATTLYQSILYEEEFQNQDVNIIYLNLVVCFRNLEDYKQALEYYNKIDKDFFERSLDMENKIEFFLVSSNTFLKLNDFQKSLDFLVKAINAIDERLKQINRFHYRRGVREKYFFRVLNNVLLLTEEVSINLLDVKKVLQIFMYLNFNSFADWLALTDWFNAVKKQENIGKNTIESLESSFEKLKQEGIPIIFGYHEKYDDPFEDYVAHKVSNFQSISMLWNSFNLNIQKVISEGKCDSPYVKATSLSLATQVVNKYFNKKKLLTIFL
ncbi:tetratricopeptide repeat protein [Priestia megaterium]|uniref:tetratricopeptide repeat protein n=1 Tax=Priestia megaterium TaxID=1404 RepID=UPI00366D8635